MFGLPVKSDPVNEGGAQGMILGTIDVARILGCSAENVRVLARSGKLPAERTPTGRRVFKLEDVELLAADRERVRQKKSDPKSGDERPEE